MASYRLHGRGYVIYVYKKYSIIRSFYEGNNWCKELFGMHQPHICILQERHWQKDSNRILKIM